MFAHDVRSILKARAGKKGVREPVAPVHNDYTIKSGPEHMRELLDANEAEQRLAHRFVEINVWRPIRGPVQSTPLAVCDSLRSLRSSPGFGPESLSRWCPAPTRTLLPQLPSCYRFA